MAKKVIIDVSKFLSRFLTVTATDDGGLTFEGSDEPSAEAGHWYAKGTSPSPWFKIRDERGPELINFHGGDQTMPSRVRNASGTEGTAKVCTCGEPDGTGVVHRIDGPCFVPVASDYRLRLKAGNDDYIALQRKLTAAEQSLAEAVRGRETALRDLRKAEQRADDQDECAKRWFREAATESARAEKAETRIAELEAQRDLHDLANGGCVPADAYSAVSDSYNEVWTDLQRANLAYKSARQRAWSWKGTAEALGDVFLPQAGQKIDQLHRKIKKLRKQRDKARKTNDERAADELESLADLIDREADVNKWNQALYSVADYARGRAAKLRGEK